MSKLIKPQGYAALLDMKQTEQGIKLIKEFFQQNLSTELRLRRVTAPLFVLKGLGINDDLNGIERPVTFPIKDLGDAQAEVVHSLAKWKRYVLKKYGFSEDEGLYTDMSAIRRDENVDNIHSIYVDQWDWEKVITEKERNFDYLKETVKKIYEVFKKTENMLSEKYNKLKKFLPEEVTFITSQELENMYPELTPEERENEFAKKNGAIFIMQIGKILESGKRHDGRAPDYDDWNLNGDLIMWNPVLDRALELSSMGIRVDRDSLDRQLKELGMEDRKVLEYHRLLLDGKLPLTIGGGIGQSRICMFLLQKAHIGEVQASIWSNDIISLCEKNGINLL